MPEPFNGHLPANPKAEQTLGRDGVVEVRLPGGDGYSPASARARHLCVLDLVEGYVL